MENTNTTAANTHKPLYQYAGTIKRNWGAVGNEAKPYLSAMFSLDQITDSYGMDSAREIVIRFLCNSSRWRGDVAREVKAELKKISNCQ